MGPMLHVWTTTTKKSKSNWVNANTQEVHQVTVKVKI